MQSPSAEITTDRATPEPDDCPPVPESRIIPAVSAVAATDQTPVSLTVIRTDSPRRTATARARSSGVPAVSRSANLMDGTTRAAAMPSSTSTTSNSSSVMPDRHLGVKCDAMRRGRPGSVAVSRLWGALAKPVSIGERICTMPQSTASDVQLPAVPAPPAPATPGEAIATQATRTPAVPIPAEQAIFLRSRRDALSRQLESVQGRRDEVAEQLRSDETQAAERPGLQDRLRVLDERLVQIEKDIAATSEQLANAPAGRQEYAGVSGRNQGGRFSNVNGNLVTLVGFALLLPFAIQLARRTFAPNRGPTRNQLAENAALNERIYQIESAVEAVALEVERIGEGQRFLTQAMSATISQGGNASGSAGAGVAALESIPARAHDGTARR